MIFTASTALPSRLCDGGAGQRIREAGKGAAKII